MATLSTSPVRLLRDPFIHFVLLGLLIFVGWWLVADEAPDSAGRVIEVDSARLQQLAAAWEQQWRRAPTRDELERLQGELVREEILYREAMALGLHEGDVVVRRRLAQKMEFLLNDLVVVGAPDPAELQQWFAANLDAFREPPQADFRHIYFSSEQRESAAADARAVLQALQGDARPELQGLGDRFLLEREYSGLTPLVTARLFGDDFAAAVYAAVPGEWFGPVRSGYGLHLVYVSRLQSAPDPALDAVYEQAVEAWMNEQRRIATEQSFARLRERYSVVVSE